MKFMHFVRSFTNGAYRAAKSICLAVASDIRATDEYCSRGPGVLRPTSEDRK
jgi:hypothetical protein